MTKIRINLLLSLLFIYRYPSADVHVGAVRTPVGQSTRNGLAQSPIGRLYALVLPLGTPRYHLVIVRVPRSGSSQGLLKFGDEVF